MGKIGDNITIERPQSTKDVRDKYRNFIGNNFERFETEMAKMHGEKYVRYFIQASKYVVPTIASIRVEDERQASSAIELLKQVSEYSKQSLGE